MSRSFPGANGNYLTIPDVAAVDVTGTQLTLAAWIKPNANGGGNWVISKENASPTASQYRLLQGGGGKVEAFVCDSGGFDNLVGNTTVQNGQWSHIAMTKNGTGAGALKVFLGGAEDGSATSNRSIQDTALTGTIGNRQSNDQPYTGLIAEVCVWALALTAAELASIASGTSPLLVQRASLRGYWPLCGTSTPEYDWTASVAATVVGSVTAGQAAPTVSWCQDALGLHRLGRGTAR